MWSTRDNGGAVGAPHLTGTEYGKALDPLHCNGSRTLLSAMRGNESRMVLRVSGQTPKQPHREMTGEDAAEEPANYLSEDRGCERLVQFLQLFHAVVQDHTERIAADPVAKAMLPVYIPQQLGNLPQAEITHRMSVDVVDLLEFINIKIQDHGTGAHIGNADIIASAVQQLRDRVYLEHHLIVADIEQQIPHGNAQVGDPCAWIEIRERRLSIRQPTLPARRSDPARMP